MARFLRFRLKTNELKAEEGEEVIQLMRLVQNRGCSGRDLGGLPMADGSDKVGSSLDPETLAGGIISLRVGAKGN